MIPGKKYTPEDILAMVWRHKWLLLAPMIVSTVVAYAWARYQPSLYRSETLILVVPQRVPENYVRSTVTASLSDRLQSISQQILSRTRLESIIKDFQLYPELRRDLFMEDVVDRMRRTINVQVVKGDAFRIAYVSDDARQAMRVTERLASLFIDESLKDREILADGTNQFLETQLQDARERLIDHEKKLEAYNRAHAGELPTQINSNLQAMNGLQMQLQQLVDSLNRDRDRRITLERMMADLNEQQTSVAMLNGSLTVTLPDQVVGQTRPSPTAVALDQARRQLQDLELRLKPAHPDIARAKRVVSDLEAKLEAESSAMALGTSLAVPGPAKASPAVDNPNSPARREKALRDEVANLDTQIASKESDQKRLKETIEGYRARVEATPTRESELTELTRDYATLQGSYRSLLTKNEEAKIAANLERRQIGEQFKILDPARLPQKPFSPDRQQIVAMGALIGLSLGVGLAALLEYRDTSLKTDEDVMTALALPVLALVPVMRSAAEQQRLRRRRILLSLTSVATLVLTVAVAIFVAWKVKL